MARLFIPDRFMVRTASEFSAALEQVSAYYWYRVHTGDVPEENETGLLVTGTFQAMHWLGGIRDVPPGFATVRLRTRYDLLDVLRITELACTDEIGRWESVTIGQQAGALEYFERNTAAGARAVYSWALRMTDHVPAPDLLPEDLRLARAAYDREQARTRPVSPPRQIRVPEGVLTCSLDAFAKTLVTLENLYERHRDGDSGRFVGGMLATAQWLAGLRVESPMDVPGSPPLEVTRSNLIGLMPVAGAAIYGTEPTQMHPDWAKGVMRMCDFATGALDELLPSPKSPSRVA